MIAVLPWMVRRPSRAAACALMLAALVLSPPTRAGARPFTVEDLLKVETFGEAAIDPAGRRVVFEKTDPYATAPSFDQGAFVQQALSRLYVADLAGGGPARELLARSLGPGVALGPFSPSGGRLAVYRLRGHRWQAGVVDIAQGAATWLGVSPEDGASATTLAWRSDRELLVLARADGEPPWVIRKLWEGPTRLPERWARTRAGGVAAGVWGSGSAAGDRPSPPMIELLRIDVDTGRRTRITSGALVDMQLSPDGRRLALLENSGELGLRPGQDLQGPHGLATERRGLVMVDLASGRITRPCPGCDLIESLLAWSPDGERLLFFSRGEGQTWPEGRLQVYAADSGDVRPVTPAVTPQMELRPETVHAAWMGRDPLLFGRPAARPLARADWFRLSAGGPVNLTARLAAPPDRLAGVGPAAITLAADGKAWRIDARGRARRLSERTVAPWTPPRPFQGGRAALQPGPGESVLTTTPSRSGGARLQAWAPDKPPVAALIPAEARVRAWSPGAQAAIAVTGRALGVQQLILATPSGSRILASANVHLADVDVPSIHEIRHSGPDGQALSSWLFVPPPRTDGEPPPLVVTPYLGATYPQPYLDQPYQALQALTVEPLVGHGYAVLEPSLPKPAPGADFVDGLAARILDIVDRAAADPALAHAFDPNRLAIWGHSYGGYTAAVTIAQTDRFRAAVSSSGPMDLAAMWGTFQPVWRVSPEIGTRVAWPAGWTETSQGGMGAPPYAAPERYVHASPIYMAGRIHTPLLMFHGDQDFVPPGQGEALFSALYRQGKDAELVTYWGEGHALASPGVVRDRFARSFAWLDRYLGHITRPAGEAPTPSRGSAPATTAPRTP